MSEPQEAAEVRAPDQAAQAVPSGEAAGQEQAPEGMRVQPDGKVQVLSPSAYKRLKDEARERGRREAMADMAKDAGFVSAEELRAALAGLRGGRAQKKAEAAVEDPDEDLDAEIDREDEARERAARPAKEPVAAAAGPSKEKARWERERAELIRKNEELARRAAVEERRRKVERKAAEDRETRLALREAAMKAGITDPGYAVHLIEEHLAGKAPEDLAKDKFDELKFFEGLRDRHPYLFSEVVRPATTGTAPSGAQAPKPGAVIQKTGQAGQVDVGKMTKQEYEAHKRKLGLNSVSINNEVG